MPVVLSGTNGVTFPDNSLQTAAASPFGLKNRLINSDMRIDQRNAGASGSAGGYTVDRWAYYQTQTSKVTWQQNQGSITPPNGFTNYFGFTSSSSYSIVSSDIFEFYQPIEGLNVADLDFGKATAKTITLSFWVRSSLTGTFGGALQNSAQNRSYPFSYTISSANTWTQISITVVGDTSGTWLTTNGTGIFVVFGIGVGATYSATAGAWATGNYASATGATSVVGTNGATWYITGVQLEIGSTATPFERRMYGQELANCQRYYSRNVANSLFTAMGSGLANTSTVGSFYIKYPQTMRASPTSTQSTMKIQYSGNDATITSIAATYSGTDSALLQYNVASGLTGGQGIILYSGNSASSYIDFTAEL